VTSPTPDPDVTDNYAETDVTTEKADLSITKTGPRRSVKRGGQVTYTLTVRNHGPSGARGVVVTDPTPDALRVTHTAAGAGSCAIVEGAVVCQLGDLASDASATVTVKAKAVRQGRVDNIASVTSRFPSDPDTAGNTAGAHATVKPGRARVTIAKRASRARAGAGQHVHYRIIVRNRGDRSARKLSICDRLPAGLAFTTHRGARLRDGVACWTISLLAPHSTQSRRVTARVLGGRAERLVNTVRIKGANVRAARAAAGVRRSSPPGRGGGVTG
jgi:uncharacterized repeat protein (TIGR01451 family)